MNRQLKELLEKWAALYVRLSRDDENEGDSNSIAHQIEILTKYAKDHGITNYKIYKDDGYSGTSFKRPGFQEMLADIEAGLVSMVVVKDMPLELKVQCQFTADQTTAQDNDIFADLDLAVQGGQGLGDDLVIVAGDARDGTLGAGGQDHLVITASQNLLSGGIFAQRDLDTQTIDLADHIITITLHVDFEAGGTGLVDHAAQGVLGFPQLHVMASLRGYNGGLHTAGASADDQDLFLHISGSDGILTLAQTLGIHGTAMAAFGRVDILVNNAGSRDPAPIDECPPEVYHNAVNSNLRGLFAAVKAVTPIMIKQGGGKIINVSSLLGLRNCNAGRIGYCSTKRGIEAMTRAMAAELGPHHIYVNSIAPGTIETNMGGLGALFTDEVVRERSKYIPLRFRGTPEMLVGPALFLASSDSDYVTGTCVIVDGGWCAVD